MATAKAEAARTCRIVDGEGAAQDSAPIPSELYGRSSGGMVWRRVQVGELVGPRQGLVAAVRNQSQDGLREAWDQAWLRGGIPSNLESPQLRANVRIVDLFAGCGAMSLGVKMAAQSLGLKFQSLVAADIEPAALGVYESNLKPECVIRGDVRASIDFGLSTEGSWIREPRITGSELRRAVGRTDILIGGPPCQGHSDLNNHSRRNDPKNSLYLVMPAVAVALDVPVVVIENVPAVVHDRQAVVPRAVMALESRGYRVSQFVLPTAVLGVAQRRKRHALVAVRGPKVDLKRVVEALGSDERVLSWAIGDLEGVDATSTFDSSSTQSVENQRRIRKLFRKNRDDLPNEDRPACHRDKSHSYVSMYGRMLWDKPAQTITSGFGSPGQGRYVHPRSPRTLTPHEASRIQFFPDSFLFEGQVPELKRTKLAVMIGNAVPPKLSYVVALASMGSVARRGSSGRVTFENLTRFE